MSTQERPMWRKTATYRGTWWPSVDRENSFQGTLAFEDRSPRLTVTSPLIGQEVFVLADTPVVHGELESGEKVTLWDLGRHSFEFLGNHGESMRNARRFTYSILGEHLEGHDNQRFRFSAYKIHGLGIWSAMDTPIPRGMAGSELPQYAPAK